MYECPHCKQRSITGLQKLCSVSFAPAICKLCQGRCYLHVMHALTALIVWVMLTWVFIGITLYQHMSIYLIGTVPAFVLAVDRYMLRAPLQAVGRPG